ncbi:MAG: alpha/beta fold hydrolase, partial [Bdellovibrionales bacterium]|nr:alpha/beta fold hydrolase [Bdellovibrionales bacterium]
MPHKRNILLALVVAMASMPARAGIQDRIERYFGPQSRCRDVVVLPEEIGVELPLPVADMHYRIRSPHLQETVVFLHGLCADSRTFDGVTDSLSRYYRTIAVDMRGQGLTPAYGWNYSTTLLAKDLHALLVHLSKTLTPPTNTIHLVGHSLGARVAVRFASLFPESVQSVVIEDMSFTPRVGGFTPEHFMKLGFEEAVENMERKCRIGNLMRKPQVAFHLD